MTQSQTFTPEGKVMRVLLDAPQQNHTFYRNKTIYGVHISKLIEPNFVRSRSQDWL